MTKKLLMTLAVGVGTTLMATANVLTPEQALTRASRYIPQAVASTAGGAAVTDYTHLAVTGMATDNQAAYYVYDNPDARGYLILSADDIAEPVLGYSDDGTYDATNENLQYWLGEYARQIAWGRTLDPNTIPVNYAQRPTRTPIAPLCKTTWGQGAPYNELCPSLNGAKCPSGCVATAMCQVMKYHNWPLKGVGTKSYSWSDETLKFDYANTTFDWGNMLNSYIGTKPIVKRKSVYTLMYAAGVSVSMNYNPGGSGASSSSVPGALIDYFNYDIGAELLTRDYYRLYEWEDAIYNNIKNVGPVYYSGGGDGGGHAFVTDGYSSDGFFHFNWGWDGLSDGYYLLYALDPMAQGTGGSSITGQGFNLNQTIVLGIQKPTANPTPAAARMGLYKNMLVSIDKDTLYVVKCRPTNITSRAATFDLALRIYNDNGYSVMAPKKGNGIHLDGGQTIQFNTPYNFPLPHDMADGTYTVQMMYKIQGEENAEWHNILAPVGNQTTSFLTITNGVASARVNPQGTIQIKDVEMASALNPGKPFKVNATAVNYSGTEQFYGVRVALATYNGSSYNKIANGTLYMLDLQNDQEFNFGLVTQLVSGSIQANKEYYLYFYDNSDASKMLSTPIKVTTPSSAGSATPTITDYAIKDEDTTVDPTNVQVSGKLTSTGGYFAEPVNLLIYASETGAGNGIAYAIDYIFANPGQTIPFSGNLSLPNITPGKVYYIALGTAQGYATTRLTDIKHITFGTPSGINDVVNAATEIERYNTYGQRLNAPAPGLNIVRYSDGSVRKEMVK